VGEQPRYWTAAFPAAVLAGLGTGTTFSTFVSAAMRDIDAPRFALAGSARNTLFQMAIALGIATAVAVVGDPIGKQATVMAFRNSWTLSAVLLFGAGLLMLVIYRPLARER
jgi:hypothetical protein